MEKEDDGIHCHLDSTGGGEQDGEMGSYLLMSFVLGILVVPIVVYGQRDESDIEAVNIVVGINIIARFLGAMALVFAFVSIHRNEREWISEKHFSSITKIKLGFLFVFGFAKIVFTVIYVTFYLKCKDLISLELTSIVAAECFTSILSILLQLSFFFYVGRYTLINRTAVKYVASLIALANFTDLLVLMTLGVKKNKDLIFDSNNTATINCTGYSTNEVKNLIMASNSFRTPIALQFSALAITLAFSMNRDNERLFNRWIILGMQSSWNTPQQLIKIVTIVVLMNVPILVCAPLNMVYPDSTTQNRIWLRLLLVRKTITFVCILVINYLIFKKLKLYVKNVSLNANETVLLFSGMGVVSYAAIQICLQPEIDSLLTTLIVISILSILYQVTLILFGRRIVLIGNEISTINNIKQLVVILACNNISIWFNDFLYGLWDMSNDHVLRHTIFKSIAMMLYPLLAYYRFQSAIELMELYRHVS
ncbi:uncharacterized protein LOC133171828 [Saccostrea echinata]|uniref:uncharacterized protein LOC133171828 n=1 Tax=Saccostrea echinata TaxID=191078 RepID=UPI002A7FB2BE|nr:uncharacterized protein LOC133171828 [Saccostrea echinata]